MQKTFKFMFCTFKWFVLDGWEKGRMLLARLTDKERWEGTGAVKRTKGRRRGQLAKLPREGERLVRQLFQAVSWH